MLSKAIELGLTIHCYKQEEKWRWRLVRRGGSVLAESGQSFGNEADLLFAIAHVRGKNEWPILIDD